MQAHRLGALKDAAREGELHHRLAPRYGEAPAKLDQGRRKAAEPVEHLLQRDIGAVFQMPRIRIVAIGAPQQATRDEQDCTQTRSIVSRRRFVGVAVPERTFLVLYLELIGSVWRQALPEIIATSRFERP